MRMRTDSHVELWAQQTSLLHVKEGGVWWTGLNTYV